MTKFRSIIISFATWIFGLSLFPNYVLAQTDSPTIDQLIEKMSLDQKVGQLFMIGFPQDRYDNDLQATLDRMKPGAVLFFKRNISSLNNVRVLNQKISERVLKNSGVKPFMAVDQEGGVVTRVPTQPPLPSALALGQTNSTDLATSYGEEVGHLLKDLGFNLNLAPVLDLSDPEQPSFIGGRSLGGNPKNVGNLGYSISMGLLRSQVVPTAKHFPGLGSSFHDPHSTLVTRITSFDEFLATDLKPFERFSELGPNTAVMLSHLSYPTLDPTNVPALFSEKIVKNLLRERLKFKGLILTDDLMMQGASQFAKPEDAAVLALKAGSDIIMVTWSSKSQRRSFDRVKRAIQNNELSMEEVNQKLRRILSVKLAMDLVPSQKPIRNVAGKKFSEERLKQIEQVILEANLQAQDHKFQSVKAIKDFCVFSSSRTFMNSFKRGTRLKMKYLFMSPTTSSAGLERAIAKNSCQQVLVTVYGKKTRSLVTGLNTDVKRKVLVVNLSVPHFVENEDAFLSVINLYFPHMNAGQKVAQYFSSDHSPRTSSK